jgi:hypothetical protein
MRAAGVAGLLAVLVAAGACSDDGEEGGGDDAGEVRGSGSTSVALDGDEHEFELTSCVSADDRLTFQGADGEGRTVLGTFAIGDTPAGSLTVSDGEGTWVAGGAGGGDLTALEVSGAEASGEGAFVVQTVGEADPETGSKPVEDTGETVEGSFTTTCEQVAEPPS